MNKKIYISLILVAVLAFFIGFSIAAFSPVGLLTLLGSSVMSIGGVMIFAILLKYGLEIKKSKKSLSYFLIAISIISLFGIVIFIGGLATSILF